MYELAQIIMNNEYKEHNIDLDNIERKDYYLTPLNSNIGQNVKLGARITMKNGQIYGNIIEIPLSTLQELIRQSKHGQHYTSSKENVR